MSGTSPFHILASMFVKYSMAHTKAKSNIVSEILTLIRGSGQALEAKKMVYGSTFGDHNARERWVLHCVTLLHSQYRSSSSQDRQSANSKRGTQMAMTGAG
jgi:hypothetical protein